MSTKVAIDFTTLITVCLIHASLLCASFMSTKMVIDFTTLITRCIIHVNKCGHWLYQSNHCTHHLCPKTIHWLHQSYHCVHHSYMSTKLVVEVTTLITLCIRWLHYSDHCTRLYWWTWWVTAMVIHLSSHVIDFSWHCDHCAWLMSPTFSTLWLMCTNLALTSELLLHILYIFRQTCLGPLGFKS